MFSRMFIDILVGGIPTPLKNMSSSVGVTIPNIRKVIKAMFQTTNQIRYPKACLLNMVIFGDSN